MARTAHCLLLLTVLLAPFVVERVTGPAPGADSIAVPGGVAGLARALQVSEDLPRARLLLTAIRLLWETPEGVDPASDRRRARVLEYLHGVTGGELDAVGTAVNGVPAFLPPETWSSVLEAAGARQAPLFTAILANRRIALLYHGIASLDLPTREYLVAHPELLKRLSEERHAAIFATFGRSLRVKAGRLVVPGGPDAVPLWEEVAGAPPTDPAAFIPRFLARDGGRLALLYDGIAHLDEGARRFALGLALPAGQRRDRFRAFYDAAGAALGRWQPDKRPFERESFDAVHLLLSMTFEATGEPAGPSSSPSFWKAVFDRGMRADRELDAAAMGGDAPLDAATLLELVAVQDSVERHERAATWLFAHRVFPKVEPGALGEVLVSLRGHPRYPTLLVTLERMGISAPATYASAVRAAGQLSRADRTLWQFQAALAVIERARAAHSIGSQAADTLVRALCAVTPEGGGDYRGAVARWIDRDFLGAVGEAVLAPDLASPDRPLETRVLAAMAGSVSSPSNARMLALPSVEWEGLKYRLDPGGSMLFRLVQVRQRQGGLSLDAVLALARLADAIGTAAISADATTAAGRLPAAAASLHRPPHIAWRSPVGDEEPEIEKLAARAMDRVRRLDRTPSRRSVASIARPLQEAVDRYLAVVLGSIAYAPHLGEADGPALLGGDPSTLHEFRFFTPGTEAGRRAAWQFPVEARDEQVGWRISGSLLTLDLAVGRLSLRRASVDPIPAAPALSDAERRTFTESALLVSAFDLTDEGRELLLTAVTRGRQRVAALDPSSPEITRLADEAGLDEWRAQALPWTLANEPARPLESFSLAELARAGGLDAAAAPWLDAWGTSGFSREGSLRPVYPARLCWTTVAGRRGVRAVAALVPDLVIGLAETSTRLGLPAAVTAGLLMVATQDFIETLQTAHADDWMSMVAHAQAVARGRTEDYVAALTITGPLVPYDEESDDAPR